MQIFGSFPSLGYPAKVRLFQQGDLAECLYFIFSGIIKLSHVDSNGKEVIVGLRPAGWLLEAASIILAQPYSTTATTLTQCQLARISLAEFRSALSVHSLLSKYLHELHAKEVHEHVERLIDLTSHSTQLRLARLLADIVRGLQVTLSGTNQNVAIPLRQWELAELLAVTPEHTNRVLQRMKHEGLVGCKGNTLFVRDANKLFSFARQ
jgi:CRP-like cAMP-binding protein